MPLRQQPRAQAQNHLQIYDPQKTTLPMIVRQEATTRLLEVSRAASLKLTTDLRVDPKLKTHDEGAAGGGEAAVGLGGVACGEAQHRCQQLAHVLAPRHKGAVRPEVRRPQLLQQMRLFAED